LKTFIAVALVVSALALPFEARSETKAELLLSGPEIPGGDAYFDASGEIRNFSGLDLRLNISDSVHVSAGSFRNSFDGQSYYAGVGVEKEIAPQITAGIEAGLIAGHSMTDDMHRLTGYGGEVETAPTAIPYIRFGSEDATNLKLLAIPPAGDISPGVVGFKLTVPFKPE